MNASTYTALANYHELQANQLADAAEVCDPAIAANTREKAKVHRQWANELRGEADTLRTKRPLRLHVVSDQRSAVSVQR